MFILDENEAFEQWKLSEGNEKEELLRCLVKLLQKHGHSICWQRVPDLAGEHSLIVNIAVWRAIKRSKSFKGKSKFSTWFHRIVLNEVNRVLKHRWDHETIPLDDVEDYAGVDLQGGIFGRIGFRELEVLSDPVDRKLLWMYRDGYTSGEIAGKLGISKEAVRKRWERLRGRLVDAGGE